MVPKIINMNCFSCISRPIRDAGGYDNDMTPRSSDSSVRLKEKLLRDGVESGRKEGSLRSNGRGSSSRKSNMARSFTFKDLATATKNFREANLIGEGGFGRVYRGKIDSGTIVAIKQLNLEGLQGNQEFMVEVLMLNLLHHPNLVSLIGYCTDGDQRLLVYEYMPMGSLEDHLFDIEPGQEPLSWGTRLKIAAGAAHGLQYLHCSANPPVIYRDLKSSNILLDSDFNPKLSDFGLAKLGPVGDNTHVSTRVMGTYGYCAPEYAMSGKLTLKSDIYSFGVVLLELVTGRKAFDVAKKPGEQNLVAWSRPFLRDKKMHLEILDPMLEGRCSRRSVHHAVAIAAMCLQEQANSRPDIDDIVVALDYLLSQADKTDRCKAESSFHSPSMTPRQDVNKLDPKKRLLFTARKVDI